MSDMAIMRQCTEADLDPQAVGREQQILTIAGGQFSSQQRHFRNGRIAESQAPVSALDANWNR